jgi:hypothetical protein
MKVKDELMIGNFYCVRKSYFRPSDFAAYHEDEEYEIASKPRDGMIKIKRGNRVREIEISTLSDSSLWEFLGK